MADKKVITDRISCWTHDFSIGSAFCRKKILHLERECLHGFSSIQTPPEITIHHSSKLNTYGY